MNTTQDDKDQELSFAETAMRMGGKSEEEAKRTGAVDKADDQVESLFAPQYKTVNSPIHKAVWEKVPLELFACKLPSKDASCLQSMERCLDSIRSHVEKGTIYGANGKVSQQHLDDLAKSGYWGMLIDTKYGGQGASIQHFMNFLTRVASIDPTTAGLASVHGCIGAVDPVSSFGTDEQKKKYLPELASGRQLSGFALTEPGAGSDLTALKTTAVLDGDHYVVNG
jgi:alkylation response protein AidB-like acyl-CoA dehydrogenase